MRKKDRQSSDAEVTTRVLNTEVGYLGVVTQSGYPRVVPLNYVADGTTVYFHGAVEGEKYEALAESPKVTFSASIPYSVIPSFWLAHEYARGATHYYESVQIDGTAVLVTDPEEIATALQALMVKYQPEGRFKEVTADDPFYRTTLEKTAVFRIDPVRVETKVNLGQQHSERVRYGLIERLEARGTTVDLQTAAAMRVMMRESAGH